MYFGDVSIPKRRLEKFATPTTHNILP